MNQYGDRAQDHWKKYLPRRYKALPDPEAFFNDLGEQISERVHELTGVLAGENLPGEDFMVRVGRRNMARLNAESQALQELALLPEEDETEETAA